LKAILLTGCNGGIGTAMADYFTGQGFHVVGIDRQPEATPPMGNYLQLDLAELVDSQSLQAQFVHEVSTLIRDRELNLMAIVNNAAVQILGGVSELSIDDFLLSQKINVAAPLLLVKLLLNQLPAGASVINIGSIHASLTKPRFVSYATSKAALRGLTQAMAVDLGGKIRVNCIEPAAIATDMLVDGFKESPERLELLKRYHPSNKIGSSEDIAELCHFLIRSKVTFLNGSCIAVDGAISSRLHDPA